MIPGRYILVAYAGLLATAALGTAAWLFLSERPHPPLAPVLILVLAAAVSERSRIRLSERVEVSIALVPVLFAAVAFGPLAALAVGALALLGDFRRPYLKWLVYTSTTALTGASAGLVAESVGSGRGGSLSTMALVTLLAGCAAQFVDVGFSSLTLSIRERRVKIDVLQLAAPLALSVALYAPVIALLAYAYEAYSPWAVLLFLLPAIAAQRLFVLFQRERRSVRRLEEANSSFATAMVATLEARDRYTAGHSAAVGLYTRDIAARLGLDAADQQLAYRAGLLHDVGKVALPPGILEKPGSLSPKEWAQMQEHPVTGERILANVDDYRGISKIVRHHHERFDGEGYPDRLKGGEIPLLSRVIAVADAYNAMMSIRPYREARSREEALLELERANGTQFDPDVVAAFTGLLRGASDTYASWPALEETLQEASELEESLHTKQRARQPRASAGAAPSEKKVGRAAARAASYERLAEVFQELLQEQREPELLRRIEATLTRLLAHDGLAVYQAVEEDRLLVPLVASDLSSEETRGASIPYGQGISGWCVEHQEARLVSGTLLDGAGAGGPPAAREPGAVICIPLSSRGAVQGTLEIYRSGAGAGFDHDEFELAKRFGDVVALALSNAELRSDLERRAATDSLTGLYNHGYFHARLQEELARARRTGDPLAVVMLDVDDFKSANDTFGHAFGDSVLVAVAETLRGIVRSSDVVCRLGGDEFAILTPLAHQDATETLCARLADAIRARGRDWPTAITLSIGVAEAADGETAAGLAHAADMAMLKAKASGKDRRVSRTLAAGDAEPNPAR